MEMGDTTDAEVEAVRAIEAARCERRHSLDLGYSRLRSVPDSIGTLSQIGMLVLSSNTLVELPSAIGDCESLVELYCSHNLVRIVPESISRLSKLVCLHLNNNRLERFPTAVLALPSLYTLVLSNNHIRDVPQEIVALQQLRILDLHSNAIERLPSSIGDLPCLHLLSLSNNRLTRLPATMGQLRELAHLRLHANALRFVPVEVLQLPLLTFITASENCFGTSIARPVAAAAAPSSAWSDATHTRSHAPRTPAEMWAGFRRSDARASAVNRTPSHISTSKPLGLLDLAMEAAVCAGCSLGRKSVPAYLGSMYDAYGGPCYVAGCGRRAWLMRCGWSEDTTLAQKLALSAGVLFASHVCSAHRSNDLCGNNNTESNPIADGIVLSWRMASPRDVIGGNSNSHRESS